MSKIRSNHVFTSESVSEGHPDKICDQISDAILDQCINEDPLSRVACETLVTTGLIVISGELTTTAKVNFDEIARGVVADIGYTSDDVGFSAADCKVLLSVHGQSADISQGVTEGDGLHKEQGAGDQGMMFGYATDETPELMPAPAIYSHQILARFAELRKTEAESCDYLRPDSKSQVSIRYDNGLPCGVTNIVVSHQHSEDMVRETLENLVRRVASKIIPAELLSDAVDYYVNPTGRFVVGGPHGDTGLTGRKIIVDTYGGVGCHGGGAFSGKDPTKVDRSAAYMCRYIAKNIVAAELARKCEIQVSYAIGVAHPLSINVDTFGTGAIDDDQLQSILEYTDIFDLRPARIIEALGLRHPRDNGWSYRQTAAYGHFGRPHFPWEKTDRIQDLKTAAERYG